MTVVLRRTEPRLDADAAIHAYLAASPDTPATWPRAEHVTLAQVGFWRVTVDARCGWSALTPAGDAIDGRCDERLDIFTVADRSTLARAHRPLHGLFKEHGRLPGFGGDGAAPVAETAAAALPKLDPIVGRQLCKVIGARLSREHGAAEALDMDFGWSVVAAERYDHPFWVIQHPADHDWRIAAVDAVSGEMLGARRVFRAGLRSRLITAGLALTLVMLVIGIVALFDVPARTAAAWWADEPAADWDGRSDVKQPAAQSKPIYWVTGDDYPFKALLEEREGTANIEWDVDRRGRVSACRVLQSSGWSDLDEAACDAIRRRGRYYVPRDAKGPVIATYSRRVRWTIPE